MKKKKVREIYSFFILLSKTKYLCKIKFIVLFTRHYGNEERRIVLKKVNKYIQTLKWIQYKNFMFI